MAPSSHPIDVDAASRRLSRAEVRSRLVLAVLLVLGAGFPLLLLTARTRITGQLTYSFLFWNLFLAAIPVPAAGLVDLCWRRGGSRPLVVASILPWLLFFPNSPYVLTDLIHLREQPGSPLWFDALILTSAGIAALLAGFASLALIQRILAEMWGRFVGWCAAVAVLGLTGFGVYLGRFSRYNSWDVLSRPRTIVYDVGSTVRHPLSNPRAVVVTALFAAFLVVTYGTIAVLGRVMSSTQAPAGHPGALHDAPVGN